MHEYPNLLRDSNIQSVGKEWTVNYSVLIFFPLCEATHDDSLATSTLHKKHEHTEALTMQCRGKEAIVLYYLFCSLNRTEVQGLHIGNREALANVYKPQKYWDT